MGFTGFYIEVGQFCYFQKFETVNKEKLTALCRNNQIYRSLESALHAAEIKNENVYRFVA